MHVSPRLVPLPELVRADESLSVKFFFSGFGGPGFWALLLLGFTLSDLVATVQVRFLG